jgi:hypothetical protein
MGRAMQIAHGGERAGSKPSPVNEKGQGKFAGSGGAVDLIRLKDYNSLIAINTRYMSAIVAGN